jgi:hypothetical protein
VNSRTIFYRIAAPVNRALWRRVEWLALRLLAASSRHLIAHRQARRVHSEAHKRGAIVPPVYMHERSARWN